MTDFKKNKLRSIISYIVAIITAMFIFLFGVSGALGILTSKIYIKGTVKRADYINISASELKETLISLAIPSGLPENFFDDKIDYDLLAELNNNCIDNAYDKSSFSVDTAKVKEKHLNIFKAYANSGALASDIAVTDESLEYLADLCTEKYEKLVANSLFKYLAFYSAKFNRFTPFAIIGTLIFAALGILFLVKLSKAMDEKKYLYFSLCGGGAMLGIVPAILLIGGFVKKISIASRSMHLFIIAFVNNILFFLLIFGIMLILTSAFILVHKKKDTKIQKTLDLE